MAEALAHNTIRTTLAGFDLEGTASRKAQNLLAAVISVFSHIALSSSSLSIP